MNPNVSLASITITMNATVKGASIVVRVCRISLGTDALVTFHNVNGGHDKPKRKRKKNWPTMEEFEFGV